MSVNIFYSFNNYCSPKRWMTYYNQIDKIINSNSKSVLVIGPGDYIVPLVVQHYKPKILVETFDIKEGATYQGDLKEISSIVNKKYDYIVCCEVLEHIEFDEFENIISQLKEIGNNILISLPKYNGVLNKWHKWEINYMDIELSQIIEVLRGYFDVVSDNFIGDKYYFFECKNNSK